MCMFTSVTKQNFIRARWFDHFDHLVRFISGKRGAGAKLKNLLTKKGKFDEALAKRMEEDHRKIVALYGYGGKYENAKAEGSQVRGEARVAKAEGPQLRGEGRVAEAEGLSVEQERSGEKDHVWTKGPPRREVPRVRLRHRHRSCSDVANGWH